MRHFALLLALFVACTAYATTTWIDSYTVYDRGSISVTASSTLGGFVASNSKDGSQENLWLSANRTGEQYLDFDLGSSQPISFIRITTVYNNTQEINGYRIDVSDDDAIWTTVATGNLADAFQRTVISFSTVTKRYLRFIATSGYGGDCCYGVGELWIGNVPVGGALWTATMNATNSGCHQCDPFMAIDKTQSGSPQACQYNTGLFSTCWVTDYSGPWTLDLDLGTVQRFDAIQYVSFSQAPDNVSVYVSTDGSTWGSAVDTFSSLSVCNNLGSPCTLPLSSSHNNRYVRLATSACVPGGCVGVGYVSIDVGMSASINKPLIFVAGKR